VRVKPLFQTPTHQKKKNPSSTSTTEDLMGLEPLNGHSTDKITKIPYKYGPYKATMALIRHLSKKL
jgi:hypothetical protein